MLHQETHGSLETRRIANVLIVDDDIDSALCVQGPFSRLGCNVEFALSAAEAKRKISSGKADLIILDWMLDHQAMGGEIVAEAARLREKLGVHAGRPANIVTFSSKKESEIYLPDNPHFKHVAHCRKPLVGADLTRRALVLVNCIGL